MDVPWNEIFYFDKSMVEMFIRGSLMYLSLLFIFRVALRRQSGSLGISDLLFITLIADASQNAMSSDYHSYSSGIVLILTIVAWNVILDALGYHFPEINRLLEPAPLCIIRHGKKIARNLAKEKVSEEDLASKLRESGIETLAQVKYGYLEGDGTISFVTYRKR